MKVDKQLSSFLDPWIKAAEYLGITINGCQSLTFLIIFSIFIYLDLHILPHNSSKIFKLLRSNRFICGNITNVGYPFWGDCRPEVCGYPHLHLNCESNKVTTIEIKNVKYPVLELNLSAQILKIARDDFLSVLCVSEESSQDPIFDSTLFEYAQGYGNLTVLYDCFSSGNFSLCVNGFNKTLLPFEPVNCTCDPEEPENPIGEQDYGIPSSCSTIMPCCNCFQFIFQHQNSVLMF
ncbi:LEAF RUST 10 DISEASE-RESISTANCE LOCUS RECEPTOR-LIKE PROTEIN KINASE-like 2.7 [Ziziphus jujuba]|uniref:LEAF RUST 10 DISEASE-RESISTANCE LOCUS RECEPTOR-LIKE PROTEIN KINASE-like 2.7 n=1 Tax=Ziziphus jujuba TaxID=326968 RepID=A0ABM4A6S4_ZIZJJ|nr:LEAF RUST 10 DISEASE-RESISTANCE LOCUS RECEPTOR-LIKE PROTEIN KINASE-like 2.7 [Ziziphus jujuba]